MASLPLSSRSAFDFVVFLPGTNTAGGSRESLINGLPQGTINITLDGVNIQDNTNRTTDGFFAIVVAAARCGRGDHGVDGGPGRRRHRHGRVADPVRDPIRHERLSRQRVSIAYRSDELNANTWFNKRDGIEKPDLLRKQPGFNIGGPVMLPGFNGRNRAFFFVNYEELREPGGKRRTRTILSPAAQQGIFRYNTTSGVQSVNLFELAARLGQTSTPDPIIAQLLADIRTATGQRGQASGIRPIRCSRNTRSRTRRSR